MSRRMNIAVGAGIALVVSGITSVVIAFLVSYREPPIRRKDGVLEFDRPRKGSYRCTPDGVLYEGFPTGEPCVLVGPK